MVSPPTFARRAFNKLRWISFAIWLSPALWLAGEWLTRSLGVNPLNRLLHVSGTWALVMLLVTLGVTPLRRVSVLLSQRLQRRHGKRVSDWNWLIRLRRQMGLFACFYAVLHLALYLAFDLAGDWWALGSDLLERPFILLGMLALLLQLPLAATSNQASMRRLGKGWRRLHLLTYPIAVLALLHHWCQTRVGHTPPVAWAIVLALLLAARLLAWRRGDRSPGIEVPERAARDAESGPRIG